MTWGLKVALISSAVMLLVNNYYIGLQNHIEHLPIIMRMLDSHYLINDFFVNASSGFGPRYYYALIISSLGKYFGLPTIFLLLTFIANVLTGYITYLTAMAINKNKVRASIAVILITSTTGLTIGAAGQLRQYALEPSFLALSIGLLGIYLLISNKLKSAVISFMFASLLHPSMGLLLAGVSYMAMITKSRRGLGLFILFLIFFAIFWVLPNKSVLTTDRLFQILAYFRNPHHILPSTFPLMDYLLLTIFIVTVFLSTYFNNKENETKQLLNRIITLGFIGLVAGYILVEIIPIRVMIPLQVWRLVSIIRWVGLLLVTQLGSWWALLIILLTSIVNKGDILNLLLISTILILINKIKYSQLAVIAVLTMIAISVSIDRVKPLPYFAYLRPTITVFDSHTDEDMVEDYARNNTPTDAIILTPPNMGKMRIRGERAIVADFKAVPYQELALNEWYTRLNEVYGPTTKSGYQAETEFETNYQKITDAKIRSVGEKYSASFAVLITTTVTEMPVLYSNNSYKLVAITY